MIRFFKNKKGFSTVELLIAVGITGAVALGGTYLLSSVEKQKYTMTTNTDYLALEKIIEGYLISPRGCAALRDLPIGSEDVAFQFSEDSTVFKKDAKIGKITIKGMKIASFASMDPDSSMGMAQIELLLYKDGAAHGARRMIPVAVNVENGIVQDCNFNHTKAYNDLLNKACYEAYALPNTYNCQQVRETLMNAAVEAICTDLYGGATPVMVTNTTVGNGKLRFCDLSHAKAGDDCGAMIAQGVLSTGKLNCVTAPIPPQPTCTAWGPWYPAVSTVCDGQSFTQYSDCTAGIVAKNSRTATGLKPVTYSYNPGPPANYCPGTPITQTNNCTGAQTAMTGTKVDPACNGCPSNSAQPWAGSCAGDISSNSEGAIVNISNTLAGYTGTADFKCISGNWTLLSGSSCNPNACSGPVNWGASNHCGVSNINLAHGASGTFDNDVSTTFDGAADITCNLGVPSITASSCILNGGGGGGGSGGGCFIAGTKINMADGSEKNIENIKRGDVVLSYDDKTGMVRENKVSFPIHHDEQTQILFTFYLSNGKSFTANDIHPFYIKETGKYHAAKNVHKAWLLGKNPILLDQNSSEVTILLIKNSMEKVKVYNLEVAQDHNYFVSDVLVHNAINDKSFTGDTMNANYMESHLINDPWPENTLNSK